MHTSPESVIQCLEELQAEDIFTLNVQGKSPLCDELVICTARSTTHARALASNVHKFFKKDKIKSRLEGSESAEWILVDGGSTMVHIMQANIRAYYDLESLWLRETSKQTD